VIGQGKFQVLEEEAVRRRGAHVASPSAAAIASVPVALISFHLSFEDAAQKCVGAFAT
jgi:hypothetical protein